MSLNSRPDCFRILGESPRIMYASLPRGEVLAVDVFGTSSMGAAVLGIMIISPVSGSRRELKMGISMLPLPGRYQACSSGP